MKVEDQTCEKPWIMRHTETETAITTQEPHKCRRTNETELPFTIVQQRYSEYLSLDIITRNNVTNCPQSRNEHWWWWMTKNRTIFQFHIEQIKKRFSLWKIKMKSETNRKSSTSRGQTPASITAWILSLVPSDKYDNAQHASVRTSSSFECIRRARAGRAGLVCSMDYKSIWV